MKLTALLKISLTICAVFLTGCITKIDGQPLVRDAYQGMFYVERQPNDGRNLAQNIATQLRARKLSATNGEPGAAPESADYIVSYIDRWQWDMRMYLISLRIETRDKNTSRVVGYGDSYQTSLAAMGMSFDDVINRALDQMLLEAPLPNR
ncbi:MAG TPA: hypothetical protein VH851_15795 [Candidatus Binatia bacterium]|jgi:hypothetical protein